MMSIGNSFHVVLILGARVTEEDDFYVDAKLVYLEGFYRVLDQQEICIPTEKLIYKLYIDKNRPWRKDCQMYSWDVK